MPRTDIEFPASDGTILRGWLFVPSATPPSAGFPALVMSQGFSAVKEMALVQFAEWFSDNLPMACLLYDNRGHGSSDAGPDGVRQESIPSLQMSDISDAITYMQSRTDVVDGARIGIWGASFSGGNVIQVAANDRRVKAVLAQMPLVDGWANYQRLVSAPLAPALEHLFYKDRHDRAADKTAAGKMPVVHENPAANPCALPSADAHEFFSTWAKKCPTWKNEVTLRSVEMTRSHIPVAHIQNVAPTPLLMTVAEGDVLTPADLALDAYSRAREPKELHIVPGGHFDSFTEPNFTRMAEKQADFLTRHLIN